MIKEVVPDFQELIGALETPSLKKASPRIETIFQDADSSWSLYEGNKKLPPLKFSNNKSQEDVVEEVAKLIEQGNKIIFIHGVCGTGKSAIALNIARRMGNASIVVPVKALQRQYEEDYMSKKYIFKPNGKKMEISMITGRDNHHSLFKEGSSCADPFLPETIKINEKNFTTLRDYYFQNPFIQNKSEPTLKDIKRISIAPANPYWSPIVPAQADLPLKDAEKKKYRGLQNTDFTFYHRKQGCSYYDQYQAYIDADVIIFNSAKYKIETMLNRKPATAVEIIDEADEFLDNFAQQETINLTRLANSLASINSIAKETSQAIEQICESIKLEDKNKTALGINEDEIFSLDDTKIAKVLSLLKQNPEIQDEAQLDEASYIGHAYEVALEFADCLRDTYLTFRKYEGDLYASLVTTQIAQQFKEMIAKNRAFIFMSGTIHTPRVLKEIFGIDDFKVVEAETSLPGTIEIQRTGKEFDCRYSNFSAKKHTRHEYLLALEECVRKAKRPALVHVNAYEDLPAMEEHAKYNLKELMTREQLRSLQEEDKTGRLISMFKSGMTKILFTTKCSRGVDFPGGMCNSIIFTKYPNPNPREIFWRVLERTHEKWFWDFYKDKARREFLQRLYRALRSPEDHIYVLSPDLRVLEAVRDLQVQSSTLKKGRFNYSKGCF